MCGIAGFKHFEVERQASRTVVERMTRLLRHRGPDGEGYYVHHNIALGHRRLAIIDIASGTQPMLSSDSRIAITFNGEIYNYVELRDELTALGHRFTTTSDTEVLIHAYAQWGTGFHSRLNGMWAFALWDEREQTLLVSRDRLGEKPVYYAVGDYTFVFASELKSVLTYGISGKQDLSVLELYLTLGYLPCPLTFYKSVSKLEAGCYLLVRDGKVTKCRYWDLPTVEESAMNRDALSASEGFESLLTDSVRLRMRSDVTFGAFLSGGLDSSTIVSIMAGISDRPVRTFTVGFRQKVLDERRLARDVARQFGTVHEEQVVDYAPLEEMLGHTLYHTDEPFGDSSAIPTSCVSRHASAHVKMVLSGDGGDEVLSGYSVYQSEKLARYIAPVPAVAVNGAAAFLRVSGGALGPQTRMVLAHKARILSLTKVPFQSRLLTKASWAPITMVRGILADMPVAQIRVDEYLADFFAHCPWRDPFYQLMYYHLKLSLPEHMLVKVDRMSMAHSIEVRTPFLDHRLVEFMVGVHKDVKLPGFVRKAVLRSSFGSRLPRSITRESKRGFVAPVADWFSDATVLPQVRTILRRSPLPWCNTTLEAMLSEHLNRKANHGNFIWMALMLANWASTPKQQSLVA